MSHLFLWGDNTMKKYITLTVVAICVLLLMVGCSNDKTDDNGTNESISFPVNSWSDEYPSDYYEDLNEIFIVKYLSSKIWT